MARHGQYDLYVSLGIPGDVEAYLAAAAGDAAAVFPNALHAIAGLAEAAHARWVAYAQGKLPLPDGSLLHARTGTYAASIKIEADYGGDALVSYTIFSDDPKASVLENGAPAWDMREILQTSHKVRVSQRGTRYLHIPFRHGTPGTLAIGAYAGREMPKPVYTWWLEPTRASSMITGTFTTKSVQDGVTDVTRYRYRWGDRLSAQDVAELGLDPQGAGKNLVGMVRMRGRDAELGSGYLTFRTLSERSKGWQHPGTRPYRVAGAVAEWLEREAATLLRDALEADVRRLQGLAGG